MHNLKSTSSLRLAQAKDLIAMLLRELEFLDQVSESADAELSDVVQQDLNQQVANFEKNTIRHALFKTKGSQSKAAIMLGINTKTLNSKLKRFSINPREFVIPDRKK